MRDIDRLNGFYDTIKANHKRYFPDLRFGQLMMSFLGWVQQTKGIDPFFPEEDRMLEYFIEYCETNTPPFYRG